MDGSGGAVAPSPAPRGPGGDWPRPLEGDRRRAGVCGCEFPERNVGLTRLKILLAVVCPKGKLRMIEEPLGLLEVELLGMPAVQPA